MLVVDDDPAVRLLLSMALSDAGLSVEEASTGAQALRLARERPYSVVLLDNQMPGMSGMAVLAELRAQESTRTLPVLIVTAEDDVAARVHGLQEGADDYVIKPFHPAELVARVRAQMRGRAAAADELERRLAERSAIAGALARIHPETTAERTAETLCAELRQLRDLAGVALVIFSAGGQVLPLAVTGAAPEDVSVGVAFPPNTARQLRTRARAGPWVDNARGHVAWAPFGPTNEPIGVLALVAHPPQPGDAGASGPGYQLLAAAIDFAAVAAGLITREALEGSTHDARAWLADVVQREAFGPVFQPIVSLALGAIVGFEALTRFADGSNPERRFIEAAALGSGHALEAVTLNAALRAGARIGGDYWLSVNVSPSFVLEGKLLRNLVESVSAPLVLEITEHDPVDDYAELCAALAELRPHVRLSVDDAGSGFASLRHVVTLDPEFVKLDHSWITGIHDDPTRQALVAGLCHFTSRTGAALIAEGIETEADRDRLAELGVGFGQGFLLGRPLPVDKIVSA